MLMSSDKTYLELILLSTYREFLNYYRQSSSTTNNIISRTNNFVRFGRISFELASICRLENCLFIGYREGDKEKEQKCLAISDVMVSALLYASDTHRS